MNYKGYALGRDVDISLEKEGIRLGELFLDFADLEALRPISHKVYIDMLSGERMEISMLGFSYDGFWEELTELFGKRSLEALFVEEKLLMLSEGEYKTSRENGRAKIALFEDSICILPQTCGAVRIPLCFAREIKLDGYVLTITMFSGAEYTVGRMGYDTKPFAERARQAADRVKKERVAALEKVSLQEPFSGKGLFRTAQPEQYWQAAFGEGVCALELFTGEDSATYLYRFPETRAAFAGLLQEAMEAMGTNREILYWADEQIAEKPLYRMALRRCRAVSFLRKRLVGRLIHTASHEQRLKEFLGI